MSSENRRWPGKIQASGGFRRSPAGLAQSRRMPWDLTRHGNYAATESARSPWSASAPRASSILRRVTSSCPSMHFVLTLLGTCAGARFRCDRSIPVLDDPQGRFWGAGCGLRLAPGPERVPAPPPIHQRACLLASSHEGERSVSVDRRAGGCERQAGLGWPGNACAAAGPTTRTRRQKNAHAPPPDRQHARAARRTPTRRRWTDNTHAPPLAEERARAAAERTTRTRRHRPGERARLRPRLFGDRVEDSLGAGSAGGKAVARVGELAPL
ncbi:hypothetical protein CLV67_108298 [Actinoplanes italicus]|uniref:Uncharacterized protein n=1 Tax=Actinoplanes italicus TaxID=113567 RepID=A0A2T0KBD3_9ACTN|nr:hypothetical protein CLV67_108298 [Actinoplanes italicus]